MVLLWQLVGTEFKKNFNFETESLLPYLKSVTHNLEVNWELALTGPIARKDENSLYKNYLSLCETPLKNIFEAHVSVAWPEFAEKYFPHFKILSTTKPNERD